VALVVTATSVSDRAGAKLLVIRLLTVWLAAHHVGRVGSPGLDGIQGLLLGTVANELLLNAAHPIGRPLRPGAAGRYARRRPGSRRRRSR